MNYQQNISSSMSGASLLMLIVLAVITAAVTVFGCGWSATTSHSVRFNDYQTEREMGRLPPLPTMANGMNHARAGWDEGDYETYEEVEEQEKRIDDLWNRAESAEKDGNLRLARSLLNEYLKARRYYTNILIISKKIYRFNSIIEDEKENEYFKIIGGRVGRIGRGAIITGIRLRFTIAFHMLCRIDG